MANVTINSLPVASTIDAVNDYLPIFIASGAGTQAINRNTLLNLSSDPVGKTDVQTLTNKTLTNPTINAATLSGTLTGTYTLGGTPTFPASVVTTAGIQTLTNKTLTSPTINSPTITNATISTDTVTGYTVSNTGTVFGASISGGVVASAALTNAVNSSAIQTNAVTNNAILSGELYTSKIYNPYKFFVYRNAAFTVTNATIVFDTKVYDTGTNYSTATGLFTVPVTGFYNLSASITASWTASGGRAIGAGIYKNGSEISKTSIVGTYAGSWGNWASQVTWTGKLTAGDTIAINDPNNPTLAGATGVNQTWFSGFLISAT